MSDLTGIQNFIQSSIDNIANNMASMVDSKGRNRYASGNTAQSVGGSQPVYEVVQNEREITIRIYMPYYYDFIDKGVNGLQNGRNSPYSFRKVSPPPLAAMREFMINRGIVPRDTSGKRTRPKNYNKALNGLAYAIGRKIKLNGIEGVPFYSNVINAKWESELIALMGDTFGEDIVKKWDIIFTNQPK
jgi:hypothetical protein